MTTADGYIRVSTEEQAENGAGLAIQRDQIERLAREQGLTLGTIHRDEGISGKDDITVRVGLAAALDSLAAGTETLIVYRLDRLARDLIVQEQVLADAWRTGATVLSCSPTEQIYCQPDNPDDPARTLIRQMLGAVAAYERAMIRLRMTRGRRRKLAATGYAGGPQPYGWSDVDERAVLVDVALWRDAGMPWHWIVTQLNTAGRMKRSGQPWSVPEIQRTHARAARRVA